MEVTGTIGAPRGTDVGGKNGRMQRIWLRILLTLLLASVYVLSSATSDAKVSATTFGSIERARASASPRAWCAPELETLPGDACYLDGWKSHGDANQTSRRTLVIFLHGAIAKNTDWAWKHERILLRVAKGTNIEMIVPHSPQTEVGYVWPGSVEAQEKVEQELIDGWMQAKAALEKRDNRPFDEVFVMGFSSGAYFVSSLAMRGRLDVDGYAVFAGAQPMPARPTPIQRFAPVFVGICANDITAAQSRGFAASLSAAGIPRAAQERPVGHGLDHVHFNSALGYLRNQNKARAAAHAMR